MLSTAEQLMSFFKDPIKEIEVIREGINTDLIEKFHAPSPGGRRNIQPL